MVTRFAFALDEAVDVRCNLNLCTAIVTALMGGEQIGAVENADLPRIGPYHERSPNVRMRDCVVVQIEANIRRLVDLHSQLQFAGVRILRQGQQTGVFAGEGLTHGDGGLFPARSVGRRSGAPERGLGIEVVEVNEFARGKEVLAYKPDCPLDAPLLPVMGSSP